MLTAKQNMLEVIRGGKPDRFVNQFEAIQILFHPFLFKNPSPKYGEEAEWKTELVMEEISVLREVGIDEKGFVIYWLSATT